MKNIIAFVVSLFLCAGTLFAAEKLRIVTTFTVPADWVSSVAGDKAEVISLVPPNADNHAYQPSPSDIKKIRDADFVFAISPKFETWFDVISKNLRTKNPQKFIFLGEKFITEDHACDCAHDHGNAHHHGTTLDPHIWMDPEIVAKEFVPVIAKTLNADGKQYAEKLLKFQSETQKLFNALPKNRRKFVTYHANMSHFAERFGLEVAGTILSSTSTEAADPSAKSLASLVKKIKAERLPIFIDNTVTSRIPATLAKEAGVPAPRVIRVDALDSPGLPAGTYLGMMQENVREIFFALAEKNSK